VSDEIDALIEEVIVDAYNEHEQLWSFRQTFEDNARFPFRATVVGAEVAVTAVDFEGDERRGLTATCRREGQLHSVSLLDVTPVGPMPLDTRQLLDAYRRWSGATPLPTTRVEKTTRWVYPRFAPALKVAAPLGLTPHGEWDPAAEYWGEPG